MNVQFSPSRPTDADTIAFPIAKGELAGAALNIEAADLIKQAGANARFEGKAGQVFETFVSENGKAVKVLLAGTGDGGEAQTEKAGAALVAKILTSGVKSVSVEAGALKGEGAAYFAMGGLLRSWRIDTYRTTLPENSKPTLTEINMIGATDAAEKAWPTSQAIAEGVFLTRELVSEPANVIYPESFVERCQEMAKMGVQIEVLDGDQMAELGMGALLGVSQGSVRPPRMLAMRWDGTNGGTEKPLVLVGKGVTFDTGGISLKPGAGMEDMKFDMGGAGAVAGTMMALAGRKANAHVVGVCGLVENMPDGNAQRPGDVVTSMSGQTIEVINTDAEGRLVLCDALHWAQEQYDPEYVIDLATLTGAIIISLAHEYAGMFTNDDGLAGSLTDAGEKSGDPVWRFPLTPAYDKMINSPIADMKNVGGRGAGSITAAQFLKRYIKDGVKWAHLDIAGTVWTDKPGALWEKGATGYGVRLLNRFVADNFEK